MRVAAAVPLFFFGAAVICGPAQAQAQAQEAESVSQAKAAALSWLALEDAGDYSAWQQAANVFRSAVTAQSWASAAHAAWARLGAMQSRKVESSTVTRTLPGAPDGEYVVIKYTNNFAEKPGAVETVTPLKEKDGFWRVSGYFVR